MRIEDEVDSILDGWFGEPLEHAENEEDRRNYLYKPLRALVRKAYDKGKMTGEIETQYYNDTGEIYP